MSEYTVGLQDYNACEIEYIIRTSSGKLYNNGIYARRWKKLQAKIANADSLVEQMEGSSILTAHYYRHNYASLL